MTKPYTPEELDQWIKEYERYADKMPSDPFVRRWQTISQALILLRTTTPPQTQPENIPPPT